MALPRWLANLNRRFLNPGAIRRGKWPVLVHIGRKSGNEYKTPIDAYPTSDGFVFTINYGPRSDWHQNVMVAGRADLLIDNEKIGLTNPRLLPADDAYQLLLPGSKPPPAAVGVEQCLVATAGRPAESPGSTGARSGP